MPPMSHIKCRCGCLIPREEALRFRDRMWCKNCLDHKMTEAKRLMEDLEQALWFDNPLSD